jgi:hypothetical protein
MLCFLSGIRPQFGFICPIAAVLRAVLFVAPALFWGKRLGA